MRFRDKVALITGGGSGIGRATALRLAADGARVFLAGRREEPLRRVADEVAAARGTAAFRTADVADDASVRTLVRVAIETFGGLDVLVNNAGYVPVWTPIHETSDDEWRRVHEINLNGPFRVARACLPYLVERGGAIVNIASISALKASNSVASYSAAKAGLIALTRCIAAEYGWQGVRCNCIVPSWVETPMTASFLADDEAREQVARRHALRRIATPDEIASAVAYLAGPESRFVTGATHAVDGGLSVL